MNFVVDKEYAVGEVFKHEQTGKTLMCVQASLLCGGCAGGDYANCGGNFCCPRDRKEGVSVIYKEVTRPVEGMLYRDNGKLFRLLHKSHSVRYCACNENGDISVGCDAISHKVFGNELDGGWCWVFVKEKDAEAPKAEPKPEVPDWRKVFGSYWIKYLCHARVRPWTKEEAPHCLKIMHGGEMHVVELGFNYVKEQWGYYISGPGLFTPCFLTLEDIAKNGIQLDGSPCGCLSVVE